MEEPGRASGRGTAGPGLEEKGPPGQEGQQQPKHSGLDGHRSAGEGAVEVGPQGTQGLSGGVEELDWAERGLGTQQGASRVGRKDYGLAALCISEGKMGGHREHIWEFLGCSGLCPAIAVA